MPRNYSNAVIYKIAQRDGQGEIYIGSTCDIRTRRSCHKTCCNCPTQKEYLFPVYQHIRENGGWDNWQVIPIEQYPCENKTQLEIRERHWVDTLKPSLNKYRPAAAALAGGRTEYDRQRRKDRYQKEKDELLEKVQCECGRFVCSAAFKLHRRSKIHTTLLSQAAQASSASNP